MPKSNPTKKTKTKAKTVTAVSDPRNHHLYRMNGRPSCLASFSIGPSCSWGVEA